MIETKTEPKQQFYFHWQNLNDRRDSSQGSGWRHGRCWWNFPSDWCHGRTIELCWNLWTHFCGASFGVDDEGLHLFIGLPPVALWLSFGPRFWFMRRWPKVPLSENYPTTMVVADRECSFKVHGGRVWIKPWGGDDWTRSDPWWKRGVSFSINPFEPIHQRHEVRRADGTWTEFVASYERNKEPDNREVFTVPYRYVLKDGTVQDRTAMINAERRSWRPRCLQWTRLFEKTRTSIDVTFSDEVGERSGSWKGGCIGCGYDLRPDETPIGALRRMERERKF